MNLKLLTLIFISIVMTSRPAFAEITVDDMRMMTLEELMEVKVETAGKKVESAKNVPASVYVITEDDIQEAGYMTMMEALSMLPGIHVDRNWYLDRIIVRGEATSVTKLLLMVDGQAMTMKGDNYNIFNGASPIEMKDIKRMEVILGPNSVLYGSGAFVGVVNVITKNSAEGININLNGSTVGERGAYLSYGAEVNDMLLSLSSGVQVSDGEKLDFTFPGGVPPTYTGSSVVADGDNTVESLRFSAKLESDEFSIRAQYSDARIVWPNSNYFTDFNDDGSYYNIEHTSVQAKHSHSLSNDLEGMLRLYYLNSEGAWRGVYDGLVEPSPGGNELWLYGGESYGGEYRLSYTPHKDVSVVTGIELTDNRDTYSADHHRSYHNGSVFAMMDYSFSELLSVQAGGRIEKYSFRNEMELLPELAMIYMPNKDASIKLVYGQGFLTPSIWGLQIADFVGNDDLGPEFIDTYELIYQHNYEVWSHSFSLFYSEHSDWIEISDTNIQSTSVARNSSYKRFFKGIDWSAIAFASQESSVELGMSYTDTKETDVNSGQQQEIPGSYDFLAYLDFRQVLPDNSVMTINGKHVSKPNGYDTIESWNRVDLIWLKKNYMGFDLRLKVGNLFDEEITTYAKPGQVENTPDHGRYFSFDLGTRF